MPGAIPAHDEARARQYTRRKRYVRLTDFTLTLSVLLVFLLTGWSQALRDASLSFTTNTGAAIFVYLLGLAASLQAVTFPLDVFGGYFLEHRYGLSNQTLGDWFKDWFKGAALSFLFGLAAGELIYLTLRRFPGEWWILCAIAFMIFFVLLTHLAPVLLFPLFFKFEPLKNDELERRLLKLSERVGARVRSVWLWKLSEKSKKANAALTGWGRTRRIILADTLVENYTPEEMEVILAHELGHHVAGDIWRGMALQSGLTFAGFYLVQHALRTWSTRLGFDGPADFANLPLLILVATGASLFVLPWSNAFSRWRERAADRFALRTTELGEAFISAMEKLAAQNLAQRRPHPLIEFVFHSHPSVEKRIAFARTWKD